MSAGVTPEWNGDGSLRMPKHREIVVDLDSPTPIVEQIDTPENREAVGEVVTDALGITTMVVDAETFLAALKRVEHAASRSYEQSLVLQCIHVTHGRVEAADNYRISRSSFGCEPCEGDFMFSVRDLPVLLAWLGTIPKGNSVGIGIVDGLLQFEVGFAARLTLPRFQGDYPNVEAVIPDDNAPVQIALNAEFLAEIKKLGKGVLRLGLWGSLRGVLFTLVTDDAEATEYLLPVRSPGIPEWGKAPDKAVDPETGEIRE